jgi:hypothetical protein
MIPKKIYFCKSLSSINDKDDDIVYILESEHNRIVDELRKHLQIMLATSDGQLDAHRSEYGESYPESEHSINAKEYLKSIK